METIPSNNTLTDTEEHFSDNHRNPSSLTLVRHVESYYNALRDVKQEWPEYHAFKEVFEREFYSDIKKRIIRPDLKQLVKRGLWPSSELLEVTHPFSDRIDEYMGNVSNYNTPTSDYGEKQGIQTGLRIHEVAPRPDVIIYSDYYRTRRTMELVLNNADADWKDSVDISYPYHPVEEMEYGQKAVWSDKQVAYVYNPHLMLAELQDSYESRKGDGQSAKDHRHQVSRFLGHVKRRYVGQNVLVFTHHLTIVGTVAEIKHFTREQYVDWDMNNSPANSSVSIFRRNETGSRTGKDRLELADEDYNIVLYE